MVINIVMFLLMSSESLINGDFFSETISLCSTQISYAARTPTAIEWRYGEDIITLIAADNSPSIAILAQKRKRRGGRCSPPAPISPYHHSLTASC